jgi:hypothetical protein
MVNSPGTDSYTATIPLPASLVIGDLIKYRILARDGSAGANQTISPATNFYTVFVTGDIPARNSYVNDFNTESFDFIGNSFSISTPANFENGAIHSEHPYADGSGANNQSNYNYQLQVPVIISPSNHFIQFDEIVLVEPGEDGAKFGDDDFFDYVVVEASKNDGSTWIPFEDGYDSRANAAWQTRYNSNVVSNNSLATGIPSFFRQRKIDMLTSSSFAAGDKIKIRFRLFADEAAHGWGWAIDNLSIQGSVTGTENPYSSSLQIFPNPAKGYLTVRASEKNAAIEIFNVEGRKILSTVADESQFTIDLENFPAGIYYLRSQEGDQVVNRKFIKVSN